MTPPSALPPVICVVGLKDSGKTQLVVALAAELAGRGHRVMTVKHGHGFQLDTPGTDSWRHRHEGGAERVVLAGPKDLAVVGGWGPAGEADLDELVRRYLPDAGIVIAEGYKAGPFPKIEAYRADAHPDPIYHEDHPDAATFLAVVTDRNDFKAAVPVLSFGDPVLAARLADLVEQALPG